MRAEPENGEPRRNGMRWQQWLVAGAAAVPISGSLLAFFIQIASIESTVAELTLKVSALEQKAADAMGERKDIQIEITDLKAKTKEIETQFCAEDTLRNEIESFHLRIDAMLWQGTFKSQMPTESAYYPVIGQCKSNIQ